MRRSALILALLVLVLVGTLAGLGIRMAEDEARSVRSQYADLLAARAVVLSGRLRDYLMTVEGELAPKLSRSHQTTAALRDFPRHEPLIDQIFVLDSRGRLSFPGPWATDLSAQERRFIERTAGIFEQKTLTRPTAPEQGPAAANGPAQQPQSYWHPYHWSDGLHLLFVRSLDGASVGAELNTARFTAELLNVVADSGPFQDSAVAVLLEDALGRTVYRSGPVQPAAGGISAAAALPPPLTSWRLQLIGTHSADLGRSARINILAAVTALIVLISAAGFYLVWLQRREAWEAMQRVTFVNQVSHELKTPLTNIRLYAELLERRLDDDDAASQRDLQVIISESQRLARLIGNILTFSSNEHGTLRFSPRPVSLKAVLQDTMTQYAPALAERQIAVHIKIEESGPVSADRDLFQQIIGNLVSNVEKYAAGGRFLEIELRAAPETTVLRVRDRGPGVPLREREQIFAPFYRSSAEHTAGVSGAGIGLTIVRELARLHGGDVRLLDSAEGALFEVLLKTPAVEEP